ncbi:MAG: RDD family protein [Gemmatimonadaceae bacterium]
MTSVTTEPTAQLRYPKARLFPRFIASLIDVYIGVGLPIMASFIGFAMSSKNGISVVNLLLLISSVIWAIYYTFTKDAHNEGRSIGKRAMKLMVVNVKTGMPCSTGESATRAVIGGLVGAVPLIGWVVEPGLVLFSDDGRRLGDKAAGTQVIDRAAYLSA